MVAEEDATTPIGPKSRTAIAARDRTATKPALKTSRPWDPVLMTTTVAPTGLISMSMRSVRTRTSDTSADGEAGSPITSSPVSPTGACGRSAAEGAAASPCPAVVAEPGAPAPGASAVRATGAGTW
mgnify:CR=1 FL=1